MLKRLWYKIECYPCRLFVGTIYYNKDYMSQIVDFSKYEKKGVLGMTETVIAAFPESFITAAELNLPTRYPVQIDVANKMSSVMKPNMVLIKFINRFTKKYMYELLGEAEFRATTIGQEWIEKYGYRTWD